MWRMASIMSHPPSGYKSSLPLSLRTARAGNAFFDRHWAAAGDVRFSSICPMLMWTSTKFASRMGRFWALWK